MNGRNELAYYNINISLFNEQSYFNTEKVCDSGLINETNSFFILHCFLKEFINISFVKFPPKQILKKAILKHKIVTLSHS